MSGQRTYADLEIRIRKRREEGYPVEIRLNDRQDLGSGYLDADDKPPAGTDGETLFGWLFAGDELRAAWDRGRRQQPQCRIRLRIDGGAAELHDLPWELLRDPDASHLAPVLAAADATPFSRFPPGPWLPGRPIKQRPLRMLVVIADAVDLATYGLPTLVAEQEWALLQAATEGLDVDAVRLPSPCTLPALAEALRQGYHVLHLVAHGRYNEDAGQAVLYLADGDNRVQGVDETAFAQMLARQLAEGDVEDQDRLRLVFLASCETASGSIAGAFRGLAAALIEAEVPAVVAMHGRVPVVTARAFARTFYRQLLQHGLVDRAANQARADLMTAKLSGADIPVLFMRLEEGRLLAEREELAPTVPVLPTPEILTITSPITLDLVRVPAGEFQMGSDKARDEDAEADELPRHRVYVPEYYIGKYPVTNVQYHDFVRASGHQMPDHWKEGRIPRGKGNHPVVTVSWFDAVAFCDWLSGETGHRFRLPTEAEWEKAARGTDGRIYPWGDELPDEDRCNFAGDVSDTTTIGRYSPQGDSPHDCADMAGNVWEWCQSLYKPYPYRVGDGREVQGEEDRRVLRGGSFGYHQRLVRCAFRGRGDPDVRGNDVGFRCAVAPGTSGL